MKTKRVTFNMEEELLDVLDAFAEMNGRTRTFVIHELLKPSLPMLKELLKLSKEVSLMSDADRLLAFQKMQIAENDLQEIADDLPGYVKEITK